MPTIDIKRWASIGMRLIPMLFTLMAVVEKFQGATGEQKKQAVLDAVRDGLPLFELAIEKDVLKDPLVLEAVGNAIDAIVAVQNTVKAVSEARNPVV